MAAGGSAAEGRTLEERAGGKMPTVLRNEQQPAVILATRLSQSAPLVLGIDLFESGFEAAHVMLDEPLRPAPAG